MALLCTVAFLLASLVSCYPLPEHDETSFLQQDMKVMIQIPSVTSQSDDDAPAVHTGYAILDGEAPWTNPHPESGRWVLDSDKNPDEATLDSTDSVELPEAELDSETAGTKARQIPIGFGFPAGYFPQPWNSGYYGMGMPGMMGMYGMGMYPGMMGYGMGMYPGMMGYGMGMYPGMMGYGMAMYPAMMGYGPYPGGLMDPWVTGAMGNGMGYGMGMDPGMIGTGLYPGMMGMGYGMGYPR